MTTEASVNASTDAGYIMNVKKFEEPFMIYGAYRLHKNLLLYIPPILVFLGTVGNALSVIILTRKAMRRQSTYFYLAVLSVADTVVLYIGLLRLWLGELMGQDVRDQTDWACKVISVFGYTISDYSGWVIIAVTVERWMAVCHPLRATTICNKMKAFKIVSLLFVLLFLVNCHFFWTVEIGVIDYGEGFILHCEGGENFRMLIDEVWPWVDAFIYSFLPFVVILVFNTLIIRQVIRARRTRRTLQYGGGVKVHIPVTFTSTDSGKITIMLMTISFTFLVLTLPMNIAIITTRFLLPMVQDIEVLITFRLVRTITELLMYVNHTVNFFLYCATGQKFRAQLVKLITYRRTPRAPYECYSGGFSNALPVNLITPDKLRAELVPLSYLPNEDRSC